MKNKYLVPLFYGIALSFAVICLLNRLFIWGCYLAYGDQFFVSFGEQFTAYSIWKVVHGYPVYEWPQKDWYSLSLYNWLFYYFYGWVCRLFQADNMQVVQVGRMVTVFFGCVGSVLTFSIAQSLIRKLNLTPNPWILGIGSLLIWFSSPTIGEVAFSTRVDVPALALATAGCGVFLWNFRSRNPVLILGLSGFLFFLAWSIKQSIVWSFAACLLYAFLSMNWRRSVAFVLSFAMPVLLALSIGGEIYRYNILYAPTVSDFQLRSILERLPQPVIYGCFIFGWVLYLPVLMDWRQVFSYRKWGSLPIPTQQLLVLFMAGGLSGLMGTLMLGKDGEYGNMLWESLVILGIPALVSIHHMLGSEIRHNKAWLIYAFILFFIPSVLVIKNTVLYKRGNMGLVAHISPSQYESHLEYGEWVKTLPPPLFIRDPLFALPWYSNQGKYPAIVLDPVFYEAAVKRKGLLEDGGLGSLIKKRYFSTLVMPANDDLVETARQSGYDQVPIPPNRVYLQNSIVDRVEGPMVMFERAASSP